jgi:hypothetical protein
LTFTERPDCCEHENELGTRLISEEGKSKGKGNILSFETFYPNRLTIDLINLHLFAFNLNSTTSNLINISSN